jgi:transcriptional regulator with XRE-family HTH domain
MNEHQELPDRVGARMIGQTLGTSLRYLREQHGMSLRALAERVDFSASFLSQIENGQCSPSISSMEKIANALGVTPGQCRAGQRTRPHDAGLVAG